MIAALPPPVPAATVAVEACGASTVALLDQILALSRAALAAVEADDVGALLSALDARQSALNAADPSLRALLQETQAGALQQRPEALLARVRRLAIEAGEVDGQLQRAAVAARARMVHEIEELDAAATVVMAYHHTPLRSNTLDRSG